MKRDPKVLLPVAVVAAALVVMIVLASVRPSAKSARPAVSAPPVEVVRVQPGAVQLWVSSQGSVEPRTESTLVAEVPGRIIWVSPRTASGGFFEAGDVLARIDSRDYDVALDSARAALARARGDETHAAATLKRQKALREKGAASEARLDDAVHGLVSAEANAREAAAAVARAELDLERTEVVAPFAGRAFEKHADVGQFVNRGSSIVRVYAVDYAEVRLPITDSDLAHLDLPLHYRNQPTEGGPESEQWSGPEVRLSARFAGALHEWSGRIVRVEGALDPQSRMLHVVARVDGPYDQGEDPGRPPLSVGMFVDASIRGRLAENVFELPRAALRPRDEVLVVDAEDRIRVRRVEPLHSDGERCWIRSGLEAGERVVTSRLEVATEGMLVRSIETSAPTPSAPEPTALSAAEAPPS